MCKVPRLTGILDQLRTIEISLALCAVALQLLCSFKAEVSI